MRPPLQVPAHSLVGVLTPLSTPTRGALCCPKLPPRPAMGKTTRVMKAQSYQILPQRDDISGTKLPEKGMQVSAYSAAPAPDGLGGGAKGPYT